jgi:hypothetical protein
VLSIGPRELIETVWIANSDRSKNVRVENREERRDQPERQRDGRNDRQDKDWRAVEGPKRVPDVSQCVLEEPRAARIPAFLFRPIDGAKLNTSQTGCLDRITPGLLILPGLHLEMTVELLFELSFDAASLNQRADSKCDVPPVHVRPCPVLDQWRP